MTAGTPKLSLLLLGTMLTLLGHGGVYGADAPAPELAARAWLLTDHDSGQVLAEHNADKLLPPASLTKLMTAYVLFRKLKAGELGLNEPVTISPTAAGAKGTQIFVRSGSRVGVEDLLKGMIVHSGNDAALALVEHVAGNEGDFVAQMNAAARTLGMEHTAFANATGLHQEGHVSTARDLARLASALIRDFPDYYKWFALKEFTFNQIRQYNRNALLWRDDSYDGVKTGQTRAAGHCLIASARRGTMRLIATVLGAADENGRVLGGQRLIDYGFRHFETRLLYAADAPATRVRVWFGHSSVLPLGLMQNLYLTLPHGAHERLRARLAVKEMPFAPVRRGQAVGTLVLDLDQKPFAEYPLVALQEIHAGSVLQQALDKIQLWLQ
jgi:D-alanyl-D-alanine carboxypeptidase (penicillin-binding protein 5/6)